MTDAERSRVVKAVVQLVSEPVLKLTTRIPLVLDLTVRPRTV